MSSEEAKVKLFISYSRKDSDFADDLATGLSIAGFEATLDRHSIIEGEDWKARLGALIADADTIVFILSPDSVQSPICQWEIEEAQRLSKRLMPVLARRLGELPAPSVLSAINFVRFDPLDDGRPRSMMEALQGLVVALKTDIPWLREHTRLLARAQEWRDAGETAARLLRGADIEAAREWANARPKDAPPPTELHLRFIGESESAEIKRNSHERKRLQQTAELQAKHAEALGEREQQVKKYNRRASLFLGASATAAAVAGVAAHQAYTWNQRFEQTQARRFRDAGRHDIAGKLVAYATSPGEVSYDGVGDHSPYAEALLASLPEPDLSVTEVILATHHHLSRNADTPQVPYFSSSLNGEIFLHRKPKGREVVSLSVGNCSYESMPALKNPINDATAFATSVEAHCDRTLRIGDCRIQDIRGALRDVVAKDFRPRRVQQAGLSPITFGGGSSIPFGETNDKIFVFYFAGMGLMVDRDVYLGFIDSDTPDRAGLEEGPSTALRRAKWIELNEMLAEMRQKYSAVIAILDMCLDDPRRWYGSR